MIIEHEKIEHKNKVIFETFASDSQDTLNFSLKNEAYFVHVISGNHVFITPSEVIQVPEGNLAFSVGEKLILKVTFMKITVLFFATLRSLTGIKTIELDLPPKSSVADLKKVVAKRFPQVAPAFVETVLVSVNREYANDELIIPENSEVALFPPVSGG